MAIIVSIFGSILGFLGQAVTCPTLESNPDSTCIGIPGGFGMLVAVRALGGLFGGTATVMQNGRGLERGCAKETAHLAPAAARPGVSCTIGQAVLQRPCRGEDPRVTPDAGH